MHVKDTTALTLKKEIFSVLSQHNLDIQNIRGQGYDCVNNIHGKWNELQILFIKDCLYVYYVHWLTYQLQLALIVVAIKVYDIHTFFQKLIFAINIVGASWKHNDELQAYQAA